MIVPVLLALGFGAAASLLCAAPRTIKDCDKIQAADAYNQCLASFGPVAHEHRLVPVPAGADRRHRYRRHRERMELD
jgi:hypothetical protein